MLVRAVLFAVVPEDAGKEELSMMVVPSVPRVSETSVVLAPVPRSVVVATAVLLIKVGVASLMIVVEGTDMTVVGIVRVV